MIALKTCFLSLMINSVIVYASLTLFVSVIEFYWRQSKAKVLYRLVTASYLFSFLLLVLPVSLWSVGADAAGGEGGTSWLYLGLMNQNEFPQSVHVLVDVLLISYCIYLCYLLLRELVDYIKLANSCRQLPLYTATPQTLKKAGITVKVSSGSEAFSFGVLKKRIVIPRLLDQEQTTSILYHEYSHLKDQDFLFHMIERLIGHVLFFNPLVTRLKRKIDFYRECKADDFVIEKGVDPTQYSEQLISMVEARQDSGVTLFFKSGSSMVMRRLKNLLSGPRFSPGLPTIAASVTLLFLLLSSVSLFSKNISSKVADMALHKDVGLVYRDGPGSTDFERKANALKSEFLKDRLVDGQSSYEIEFRKSGLYVNGKKERDKMFAKYVPMVNDLLGQNFAPGGIIYLSHKDYE